MATILVATDLSTRSDRAVRRATLLARGLGGSDLLLASVIDDERPERLVHTQQLEVGRILRELAETIEAVDGIACRSEIRLGQPPAELANLAASANAMIMVIGPHRREFLRDEFAGTMAERIIRSSPVPILVANSLPVGPYSGLLFPTDMSEVSRNAIEAVLALPFTTDLPASALHIYDAEAREMHGRALVPADDRKAYLADRARVATQELTAFAASLSCPEVRTLVRESERDPSTAILNVVSDEGADLIALARSGKRGIERLMLGSVAASLVRDSDVDLLVMP